MLLVFQEQISQQIGFAQIRHTDDVGGELGDIHPQRERGVDAPT